MTDPLTLMPAAKRRAFVRVDNCTRTGFGSPISVLSEKTKELCLQLFDEGLVELWIEPDGSRWFRTSEQGQIIRDHAISSIGASTK